MSAVAEEDRTLSLRDAWRACGVWWAPVRRSVHFLKMTKEVGQMLASHFLKSDKEVAQI